MTNKKTTKRALLFSVLSTLLCVTMLMGTTFAWFTDSVTSANNIIKSGNLDIELEYWNETAKAWVDVEGKSDILTNTLWEPGVTEVAYLKVKNAGSLALKYQLGINIVSEIAGVNQAGESFLLSDYIQFGVVEEVNGETGAYANREAAVAAVTNAQKLSAGYTKAASMASGDELYLALVVYMPTTVGNEANHNGVNVPQIDLGINVFATQYTAEADSFGSDYDTITIVGNEAELAAALQNGGEVMLAGDITIATEKKLIVPAGVDAVLNMNGKTIKGVSAQTGANQNDITVKGDLTVRGNGSLIHTHTGANMGWGNSTSVFSVEAGTLTLEEGVEVINAGGSNMAYGVDVNTTLGESVLNVNGANIYSTYTAVREFNNSKTQQAIVNVNSGIISGGKRDIWAQNPSAAAVDANAIVNIAAGYDVTMTTQAASSFFGRIYDFNYAYTYAIDGAGLKNALENGATDVVVVADIALAERITVPAGANVTLDLNGKTISGTFSGTGNQEMFLVKGNLTVFGGEIEMEATVNQGWSSMAAIFDITAGGALNMDNVSATVKGTDMNFIAHLNNWGTASATITNCDFELSYVAVRAFNSGYDMNTVTIKNTDVTGGARLFWVHNYTAEGKDDSTLTLDIYGNNNTSENATPVRFGFSNSLYYTLDGAQIVTAPITVTPAPLEEDFLFPAGTNAVIYKDMAMSGEAQITHTENVVLGLSNVTAELDHNVIVRKSAGAIVIENCNFTLTDGAKLISVGEGGDAHQVFMVNVTINGVLMDNTTIWNYVEGISYISIVSEWPNT